METLSPVESMVWVFVGIILSFVLPVVVQVVRKAAAKTNRLEVKQSPPPPMLRRFADAFWRYASIGLPYLIVLGAAVVLAVALVFLLDLKFYHARDAALAGIAWESLVNKVFGRSGQPNNPNQPD